MAIREYAFNVGVETSELPSTTDPSSDSDLVSKGYADKHYMEGRLSVADVTALKAVAAADRTDGMVCLVESVRQLYSFDADSSESGDDDLIVQPSAGTGRWYKLSSASTGSGSGELNYVENPSAASSITGWANVGDLDVARTTTAAQLPRENTTATGILITADANTQSVADYVYYDFTLDDVDLNRLLKIEFDQKVIGTYTAGQLAVVITTQADRTTAVATPSVTAIPASDGTFGATFMTDSTAALSLVIRATGDMTTGDGICISNVIVGPGQLIQGVAVGDWTSYTPTWSGGSPAIGNGTLAGKYRRVGDSVEVEITLNSGTSTTWGDSTNWQFSIPTGLTINTSKLDSTNGKFGSAGAIVTGSGNTYHGLCYYASSNTISIATSEAGTAQAGWDSTHPATWTGSTANQGLNISFTVPVNEWSSNIYLGSGADSTSVLDWTSYTYSTPSWLTLGTSPIQTSHYRRVGDSVEVRIHIQLGTSTGNITDTIDPSDLLPSGIAIDTSKVGDEQIIGFVECNDQGTGYFTGTVSYQGATDFRVRIHGTSASAGATVPFDWTASDELNIFMKFPVSGWTAQDYLGKMLTGFATAGVGRSGLVNNDSSNTGGTPIKGRTDGGVSSSGYIGELFGTLRSGTDGLTYSTRSTTAYTSSNQTLVSLSLNKGIYLVSAKTSVYHSDAALRAWQVDFHVGGTSVIATISAPDLEQGQFGMWTVSIPVVITSDSTAVSLYGRIASLSGSSSGSNHELWAVRIA
jgi:hypothetical protein